MTLLRLPSSIFSVALISALVLALPACMGTEAKVRQGLINAGLSRGMAGCMAKPMADDLSLNQLMKLNSLGRTARMDRNTSLEDFLRRMRALEDPEIMRVTARAATDCFIQRF